MDAKYINRISVISAVLVGNKLFVLKEKEQDYEFKTAPRIIGAGTDTSKLGTEAVVDTAPYIKLKKETNLEMVEVDVLSQAVQKRFSVPILEDETVILSDYTGEAVECKHTYHIF